MVEMSSVPQPLQTILRDLMAIVQKLTKTNDPTTPVAPATTSASNSSADNALGWMQKMQPHVRATDSTIREAASQFSHDRDLGALANRLRRIDLSWLRSSAGSSAGAGRAVAESGVAKPRATMLASSDDASSEPDFVSLRNAFLFLAESVCPWDYDRKEPALTFVNVWTDVEAIKSDRDTYKVKIASTINPLAREWKVTARTRLASLGNDKFGEGCLFGKAGIYLVGDKEPYVGVEADRTLNVPFLPGTALFVNANFKSSRKPNTDPIVASAGVQQTIDLGGGLALTLRAGYNSLKGTSKLYISPVPFGSYF
jgi:hypothetical protein